MSELLVQSRKRSARELYTLCPALRQAVPHCVTHTAQRCQAAACGTHVVAFAAPEELPSPSPAD